jgi:NAD-dependent SIR2 family protein deacetylase
VYPAAQIPLAVKLKRPPAFVIEVNREPSALNSQVTDITLTGSAAEVLHRLDEAMSKLME